MQDERNCVVAQNLLARTPLMGNFCSPAPLQVPQVGNPVGLRRQVLTVGFIGHPASLPDRNPYERARGSRIGHASCMAGVDLPHPIHPDDVVVVSVAAEVCDDPVRDQRVPERIAIGREGIQRILFVAEPVRRCGIGLGKGGFVSNDEHDGLRVL